jgi:hypothetical protein
LQVHEFTNFVTFFINEVGIVGLFQQRTSFAQWVLQRYIETGFQSLRKQVFEKIEGEKVQHDSRVVKEVSESFKLKTSQLMGDFTVLIATHPDSKYLILQGVGKFLTEFLGCFEGLDENLMLLSVGICHLFSTRLIPFIFELVSRFDPESPLLRMRDGLQDDSLNMSLRCLERFVSSKRRIISELLRQGLDSSDWQDNRAPRDVSICTRLVLEEVSQVWVSVETIINESVGDDRSSQSSLSSRQRFSGFSGSAVNSSQAPVFHGLREDNVHQIDRLFTTVNRLHLGRKCEFSSKSVLTKICLFSVKTLLEHVRKNGFSSEGFKQMQIDCYFIYMSLFDKVEEVSLLNVVLEEILSSAADRTTEPIPLQVAVLSDIYTRSDCKPQGHIGVVEE